MIPSLYPVFADSCHHVDPSLVLSPLLCALPLHGHTEPPLTFLRMPPKSPRPAIIRLSPRPSFPSALYFLHLGVPLSLHRRGSKMELILFLPGLPLCQGSWYPARIHCVSGSPWTHVPSVAYSVLWFPSPYFLSHPPLPSSPLPVSYPSHYHSHPTCTLLPSVHSKQGWESYHSPVREPLAALPGLLKKNSHSAFSMPIPQLPLPSSASPCPDPACPSKPGARFASMVFPVMPDMSQLSLLWNPTVPWPTSPGDMWSVLPTPQYYQKGSSSGTGFLSCPRPIFLNTWHIIFWTSLSRVDVL